MSFNTAAFIFLVNQIPRIVIFGPKDMRTFKFNIFKPDMKGHILYYPIYLRYADQTNR